MKKIDGLKFLTTQFPNFSINSIFIDNIKELNNIVINKNNIFRVRGANKRGTELNLPMGTFYDIEKVKEFIICEKKKNEYLEFVIHCVDEEYFNPIYVGTVAVYNSQNNDCVVIELQKVTKELIEALDSGVRPRDWPISAVLEYAFLSKSPIVKKYNDIDLNTIKEAINQLFKIGITIFEQYSKNGIIIDTYTRFNIYGNNTIILDDHRSAESFVLVKK